MNVKRLLDYYGKGLIILAGIYTMFGILNTVLGMVVVSEFWQGAILVNVWWNYSERYKHNIAKKRITKMMKETEEIIRKYDNGEITEEEMFEGFGKQGEDDDDID